MLLKYKFIRKGDYYTETEFNDSEHILEGIFNFRITDASDWSRIIDDVEFVMNSPNEHAYNPDGSFYTGKYNIEHWHYDDDYHLSVSYDADNVITYTCVDSNKDFTRLTQDRKDNKELQVKIPTIQILVLIRKWRDFLLSEKTEEEGEVEIDFWEVVYYDRKNVE